jgi:hypothetical protein
VKFLIIFKQGTLHFYFALDSANSKHLVGLAKHSLVIVADCGLNFSKYARSQILLNYQ